MDEINLAFLDNSFTSTLNDMATNKDNIKNLMGKFISKADLVSAITSTQTEKADLVPADLVSAIKSKEKDKADFLQVNVAVFKALKMYIFYKVGYDYTKLQKIERFFYRFLYVADKLINMYDESKTEEDYTKCFRKYFKESNNFARKTSNPFVTKGEDKFNGFFKKLEKVIIDPSRLTRHKYKEELKALDKKVNETQNMISAAEQQEIKIQKAIKNLLQEHSNDPKTAKYIVDEIIFGSKIVYDVAKPAGNSVGGKAKRRMMGGGLKECIVAYLNDIVEISDVNIISLGNGRYKVNITDFTANVNFTTPSVLPEVKTLIDKYDSTTADSTTADKLIKVFNLATKNIKLASNCDKKQTYDELLQCINKLLTDKVFAFKIIKYKYENHPMVILNNKLEALV